MKVQDEGFGTTTQGAAATAAAGIFRPPFDTLPPAAMLAHFRQRSVSGYFPLQTGKPKHVAGAERILRHEFDLNNETHVLADNFDWRINPSNDPEWLILLHKFYYSRDLALAYDYSGDRRYADKWMALVSSWIAQVPHGYVNSQVTGRRIQQWLLAYHYFVPGQQQSPVDAGFLTRLLASLQSQALFLSENLTPEGNHRTIELYAIFSLAVLFPELHASDMLLAFAKRQLLENLREDFLADGVHKELSTDYHHTVLKNFLRVRELAALNGIVLADPFDALIAKALRFSVYAHKPDGGLPAINDGDMNSYLSLLRKAHDFYPSAELLYAATAGQHGRPPQARSRLFAESGYAILRSDWEAQAYQDGRYLFFDCGGLGFGSHGHYDLLSFEAAAFGRSLVVDPGRYTYHEACEEGINWRHAFKGTAAHNTVMIDGKDQIAYQCHHPLGEQPAATLLNFVSAPGFDFVHGKASSPQYPVEHQRSIFFADAEYWIVTDLMRADDWHRYDQFFHLAADPLQKTRRLSSSGGLGADTPNLLILQPSRTGVELSVETGWISPEYGLKQQAPVLRYYQKCIGDAYFQTVLYPYAEIAPALRVAAIPVTAAGDTLAAHQAVAIEIGIQFSDAAYQDYLFVADESSEQRFTFAEISCRARMLYLRRDSAGNIVSLRAEALRSLRIGNLTVLDFPDVAIRVSYRRGSLYLRSGQRQWEGRFDGLEGLQRHIAGIFAESEVRPC